jgi:hypothetical protein
MPRSGAAGVRKLRELNQLRLVTTAYNWNTRRYARFRAARHRALKAMPAALPLKIFDKPVGMHP